MVIKVLGKGCKKCGLLEDHTRKAIEELKLDATVEKVTDQAGIDAYNVLQTPALVVDEKVIVQGRVPSTAKLVKLLS